MTVIHFDANMDDDKRRQRLFAGDIFVHSATPASMAFVELARQMLSTAFAPHHPELAQHGLPVEDFAKILADVKPAFIHHPDCKSILPEILNELHCDLDGTYFDVPRLRTSTSDGYLTTGIAYAFHPHRDTWYSAPQCQLNWWMPVWEIEAGNGMTFYPNYFSTAIKNSSHKYNYYRWNRDSRAQAAKQIGKDTRAQPKPEEPLNLSHEIRLVPSVGEIVVFSGAQLHASVPNTTGRTRISIDFRTVNFADVKEQMGAPNVDSACTGTTLRDFLRCTDLERLPEDIIARYDSDDIEDDAPKIFDPNSETRSRT